MATLTNVVAVVTAAGTPISLANVIYPRSSGMYRGAITPVSTSTTGTGGGGGSSTPSYYWS